MPRRAREKSNTGIYHIMMRGINHQEIFHEEQDYQRYVETLQRIILESEADLLGYCLMDNHTHLLIKENVKEISHMIKRLGASYAWWYNWKYERSGHVFQDRFRSEKVEEENYLLLVIRYIHQNPVKAGIVAKPEDHRWSSCSAYYGKEENPQRLTQTKIIFEMLSEDQDIARKILVEYMEEGNDDQCLEDRKTSRVSDEVVRDKIKIIMKDRPFNSLQHMEKAERNKTIRKIKEIEGISLRQIARITGLNLKMVYKA
jgi:putative transposase